jgi:hypothetical protein
MPLSLRLVAQRVPLRYGAAGKAAAFDKIRGGPQFLFLLLFSKHFHCGNGSTTSQSNFFFLPSLSGIAKAAPFVELVR